MDQPSFSSEKNVISTDNFLTVYFDRSPVSIITPITHVVYQCSSWWLLYFFMIWNCQNVVECPDSFYCVCVHKLGLWCHFLGLYQKKERRHKSYKICIVDKSFIQLQFHEANILIVQLFGQLTKGIFYNLKILTLSCFRRHKDLKLLLNLLAETSGVSQLFFCNCVCWSKEDDDTFGATFMLNDIYSA